MTKEKREYVDHDHPEVSMCFYEALEKHERNPQAKEKEMKALIRKDPDFLDPYLILYETYSGKDAESILEEAYGRALKRITNEKGEWPDSLEWIHLENRHIIRTLLNKAISLWDAGKNEEALDLFRKLLKTNPNDNAGARNNILAIRMGMTRQKFEKKFDKGGYYDSTMFDWFDKNHTKYPDEFGWWVKATEE